MYSGRGRRGLEPPPRRAFPPGGAHPISPLHRGPRVPRWTEVACCVQSILDARPGGGAMAWWLPRCGDGGSKTSWSGRGSVVRAAAWALSLLAFLIMDCRCPTRSTGEPGSPSGALRSGRFRIAGAESTAFLSSSYSVKVIIGLDVIYISTTSVFQTSLTACFIGQAPTTPYTSCFCFDSSKICLQWK